MSKGIIKSVCSVFILLVLGSSGVLAQFGDEGSPTTVFAIFNESPGSNCAYGGSLIALSLTPKLYQVK